MPQFLLDTDHVSLLEQGHLHVAQKYRAASPGSVDVSATTVEESLRGRLAFLSRNPRGPKNIHAYASLLTTFRFLATFPLMDFDQASERWFDQLVTIRPRIGTQDLRIAAVALANGLIVLTRNRRDFGRIPGLVLNDWSV